MGLFSVALAEAKEYTRRNADIVLGSRGAAHIGKTREQIVGLNEADGETRTKAQVQAAAHGHCKSMFTGIDSSGAGLEATATQQNLCERGEAAVFSERIARAEQIRIHGAIHTSGQATKTVAPDIGYGGQCLGKIVSEGCIRTVQM